MFLIIFTNLSFHCCKNRNIKEKKEQQLSLIDSINVLFYNYEFDRMEAVDCNEIEKANTSAVSIPLLSESGEIEKYLYMGEIIDTVITNQEILKEIEKELFLSKEYESFGIDARMKCFIKYQNHIDTLCLSVNPVYGYLNGKPMLFSNKFVYLIRKYSGFYNWFNVNQQLQYFDELNDTTFMREKVINRWREEY